MTSLDLGDKFDTSNVTNMEWMFSGCGNSSTRVYVKSNTEKTWVTTNKCSEWENSNIIVGSI